MRAVNAKRTVPALKRRGVRPYVTDVSSDVMRNNRFRSEIWTGENLQMIMMSIPVAAEAGLDVFGDADRFLYVVSGSVLVEMGNTSGNLSFRQSAVTGYGIFVPAGVWHNLSNTGKSAAKLFSVYAPPEYNPGFPEPVRPPVYVPSVPTYPSRPVRPPSVVVPQVPTYPSRPVRPTSVVIPQVPTYPSRPVRPTSVVVPQVPTYPSRPVRPPSVVVPQMPTYPANPVGLIPLELEADNTETEI